MKRTNVHRSTAFVQDWQARLRYGNKTEPISPQFRFIVRMAYACYERGVPYNVVWWRDEEQMRATVMAVGAVPTPRALPKPPAEKPVAHWRPTVFEAVYRLEAYAAPDNKRSPGFVIEHSSGLALVHPSDSGELGVTAQGQEDDIRQNWRVTHLKSGRGYGVVLSFKRAIEALLFLAAQPVDWTQELWVLVEQPEARRANTAVLARYGAPHQRRMAQERLESMGGQDNG